MNDEDFKKLIEESNFFERKKSIKVLTKGAINWKKLKNNLKEIVLKEKENPEKEAM